jgi:hypothetical protein
MLNGNIILSPSRRMIYAKQNNENRHSGRSSLESNRNDTSSFIKGTSSVYSTFDTKKIAHSTHNLTPTHAS